MCACCGEYNNIIYSYFIISTILNIYIKLFLWFSHVEQVFKPRIHECKTIQIKLKLSGVKYWVGYTKAHNIEKINISVIVRVFFANAGYKIYCCSRMDILRTDEKNRFLVETIKSIIIVKIHFKIYSCNDLYNMLLKVTKLPEAISWTQK